MTVLVVPEHKPANSSQYKNENQDGEEGCYWCIVVI